MLYTGWFKIHRSLYEKAIWKCSTPEQKVILFTILGMVNFRDNQWEWNGKKFDLKPGQMITSLDSIVEKTGDKGFRVSIKNVRTAIKKFEKFEFLINESAKTGRLVTVLNWEQYQEKNEDEGKATGKQVADKGQTGGKQVAAIEEGKEDKKDKKGNKKPTKKKIKTDPPNEKEWIPSKATQEAASNHGYTKAGLFIAITQCFDWARGKGEQKVDWDATVRNWMMPNNKNNFGQAFKVKLKLKGSNGIPESKGKDHEFTPLGKHESF